MPATNLMSRIAWIGFGKMGTPICGRLREAGYRIYVLCRSARAWESATAFGLDAVSTSAEAASGADIIVSAISDDAALLDIVFGPQGLATILKRGQIYVDTSTVSPVASAKVAQALAEIGVPYLRAPVSGSTALASKGMLTAIVSGPIGTFSELKAFFDAFTRKAFHVGETEEARYLKLAINSMVGATSALLAEALTLARAGGIDAQTAMNVITDSAVASPLIQYKSAAVSSADFTAAFSCSQMLKDFNLIEQVAVDVAASTPLMDSVRRQFSSAVGGGFGEHDFFVLTSEKVQEVLHKSPLPK